MTGTSGTKPERRLLAARIAISGAALVALVLHARFRTWIPEDALSLGLIGLLVLPWLVFLVEEAEFGGAKLKFRKLQAETDEIRQRLGRLILSSLSDRLREELDDFAIEKHVQSRLIPAYVQELWHLHNLGYIRFRHPHRGFDDIPKDRDVDVLDYLEITPVGSEYLRLVQSAGSSAATAIVDPASLAPNGRRVS